MLFQRKKPQRAVRSAATVSRKPLGTGGKAQRIPPGGGLSKTATTSDNVMHPGSPGQFCGTLRDVGAAAPAFGKHPKALAIDIERRGCFSSSFSPTLQSNALLGCAPFSLTLQQAQACWCQQLCTFCTPKLVVHSPRQRATGKTVDPAGRPPSSQWSGERIPVPPQRKSYMLYFFSH